MNWALEAFGALGIMMKACLGTPRYATSDEWGKGQPAIDRVLCNVLCNPPVGSLFPDAVSLLRPGISGLSATSAGRAGAATVRHKEVY